MWAFLPYFIDIQKNIFTGNQFQFINEISPEMRFLNSMQAALFDLNCCCFHSCLPIHLISDSNIGSCCF